MKKGFTLIELMIVVAIIAIIAAIAIPNLMRSRMAANESNAVAALKTYGTNQTIYKNANYSETNNGGSVKYYTDDYTLLYSGVDGAGTTLKLITEAFANADGGPATAAPYQGYGFADDASLAGADWANSYALYADPAAYGKSGTNSYWINEAGGVKMIDLAGAGSTGGGEAETAAWNDAG